MANLRGSEMCQKYEILFKSIWCMVYLGFKSTRCILCIAEARRQGTTPTQFHFLFLSFHFQISASTPREPTSKYPGVEKSKHVTKNQTLSACQERRSASMKRTHEYQMHNASNKEMNTFPYICFKKYFSVGT